MAKRNRSLHGSTPERSKVVLLLIDVINDFDFRRGKLLYRFALSAAQRIAALKSRAARSRIPAIYVNDNFGRWKSDFTHQIDHCLQKEVLGKPIVEMLRPDERDYFVLKPKHSGFFCTSLDILLEHLGAETLVLTGFASNICVLHTANDAFMRDFNLIIPSDCVAAETRAQNSYALKQMKQYLKAEIKTSPRLSFGPNKHRK